MNDDEIYDLWMSIPSEGTPKVEICRFARALLAAGASEGQEPVAQIVRGKTVAGRDVWDIKIFDKTLQNGAKLYKDPSAEIAALRERIAGMEKEAGINLPRVHGISRIADNPCALLLLLKREPTDDEVRGIHDAIAKEKQR